ncbi:MAG: hypothetical protein OHK0039_43600 [Bacteroidia bacterium]
MGSLDWSFNKDERRSPANTIDGAMNVDPTFNRLGFGYGESRTWFIENTLTYARQLGKHDFSVMAGYQAQNNLNKGFSLCAYGGFVAAPVHDPDRPVGWLRLISAATGRLLAQAPMPDGAETYLSPVLWPVAPQPLIVFGSGGETLPGGLYVAPLADLLDGRFDSARCLARGDTRGFIAAPTLADTDGDGAVDLLVQAYDGSVWAFDGRSQALRWRMNPGPGYESHVRPVWLGAALPGQVLVTLNRAAWPAAGGAVQWLLDAATGAARPLDSLGNWQMATPVWQGSAAPTLFYTINEQRATGHAFETGLPAHTYVCRLVAWQWPGPRRRWLDEAPGINLGADVLVEDIDGDGHTELIWLHNRHPYDIDRFGGVRVSLRRL